jgi:DNA repair protein RadC
MAENKRHKGHRQRMRERVQSYGLDSLAEHEALEYVLYLTNAQKDTNGIAHDLIDRFGDFAAVLEASEEEASYFGGTVEGVGPSTARMLHLLPQISRYYGRSRTSTTRCIKTTEQMGSYLMAKFAWSDYERAMLVSLDSRKRVRAAVWLREGTSDRVSLDIKNVVAAAIKGGTDAVVLCQSPQRGGAALAGRYGRYRQHCPGAGVGKCAPAGSLHPDRHRVFFHAGRQPPAYLRLQDRDTFLAVKQKTVYIIKCTCY